MTGRRDDEEIVGIDGFTWVVDDPAPNLAGTPPQRPLRDWLWRSVAFAVAGAGGMWLVARLAGYAIPYVLLVAALLAASALRRTLAAVAAPRLRFVTGAPAIVRAPVVPAALGDGLELATRRWDNRLSFTERDDDRFASAIRPRLVAIVDERLRLRHGVSRADNPVRARRLLGDPLWTVLHAPTLHNPSPRELAAILAQLEKL
jgi:hypothetical protein